MLDNKDIRNIEELCDAIYAYFGTDKRLSLKECELSIKELVGRNETMVFSEKELWMHFNIGYWEGRVCDMEMGISAHHKNNISRWAGFEWAKQ